MAKSSGMDRSLNKKPGLLFLLPVLLLIATAGVLFLLFELEKPRIDIDGKLDLIGGQRRIAFTVSDAKSGIREIRVAVRQAGVEKPVLEKKFERQGYFRSAGQHEIKAEAVIDSKGLGLQDGPAELLFLARDFSLWGLLRGNRTEQIFPVTLDTKPPLVSLVDSSRYIKPGGAGMITYQVSEAVARHGVLLNDIYHPGFPIPTKDGLYGAIISLSYDTAEISQARIEAVDQAGNIGNASFSMLLKKVNFKQDSITISDNFLQAKMPEFAQHYPQMSGSLLDQFLFVNNTVRIENNNKIMEVCRTSTPERLWEGRFGRMEGSGRAGYADHRTYFYQGKEVDKQVHLGMDIAATERYPVQAANRGRVVFADYLGIYGNMVILDHGLGVCSLYSHLSAMSVAVGDMVDKGAVIGNTGTTGMAGGDHLHFSMLVNGILVNPVEWWDQSWMDLYIHAYLK
ncbi:MAG: M23 family metallopeptidase [Thermodesulfobacteriota bacterium]